MEMKILGKGISLVNELVEIQKEILGLIGNEPIKLQTLLRTMISDLDTKLTNELMSVIEQIDIDMGVKFRENGSNPDQIASMNNDGN
jgi:hypothetical protein